MAIGFSMYTILVLRSSTFYMYNSTLFDNEWLECAYFRKHVSKHVESNKILMSLHKKNYVCRLQENEANPNLVANEKKCLFKYI